MSEIRPTSQQMDRETLSQDIEKLKLAVKDTSLNRTWDDYSDSDDDALHITEDQNSRDVNDDGQLGERMGVVERFFPEEAIQGISQDSLGSLGSVELANSPEVCLALNREYQDWIRKNLTRIQIVLEHNRQCQREVRLELQEKSSEKMALNAKRKTLTVYARPYFKTADGSFPPPNEDTVIKRNSRELDPFIRPPKSWSNSERNKLRAAVQADRLQKALRPFMARKEGQVERLRMVTPDSEEEKQIKDKIEEIDDKMKAIRVSTDINVIYGDLKDLDSIDWMKIANVDFEGQRSPESCKLFWLNAAHPNINVLKWTSAEDSRLTEFVSRFEGVHWMEIAQGIGTNRSAFMCLQRYQTKLNPCLQTGKWTPEEDDFLKEVINNYKSGDSIPWSTVAYYVEGRSREQCARRWEQLHPKSFKKGKWTVEEDRNLMEAAKLFGVNKWWKIKEFVPGRTAAQCRERWKNTLDYTIHFGEWRYEEDRTLWLTVQELGAGHWQSIAKDYLPGRTDNMCLQRYRRLVHWYQENKSQERVRRQAKSGGWRQNRRWRRPGNKQYLKRKQLEKVLDRVKTNEKEKEILSALKYVEGICDDGQGQGDGGRLEKSAEQISGLDNRAVAESGAYLYTANEIEAMRRDQDLGIVIPRPSTRSCMNRNFLPELNRYRMRHDIGKRVVSQVLSERRDPSSYRSRLEDLVRGKGNSGFSQPLQEKLQSLSDNATIRELIDLSAEVKQEVSSTLGSSSGQQQRGRPKRSEEEMDVEHKLSMLIRNPVIGTRGLSQSIKFLGEDSGRTGLRSTKKNAEDKQGKVVHLMSNALGFRRCPPVVYSSPVQSSSSASSLSDATPQTIPVVQPSSSARHEFAKMAAKAISSLSPESSVVVVLKRVSSSQSSTTANKSLQHTPQTSNRATPELTTPCATNDPRLNPNMLKKSAYGRAALEGERARIYQMPPLPPSCCTLNAFKSLLLNRTKLLSVAGKFHIPGILPVPKSLRQQGLLKTDDKSPDSATRPGGTETKASTSAESLENGDERNEMGAQQNSPAAETELCNAKSAVDDGIRNNGHSPKGLKSSSKKGRLWAESHKTPRKLSRPVDKDSKQLQVVKSKLRSRRVLAAIHASHDYQLLRSRFLSLFLWPALMSTLPVEEVKRSSSLEVTQSGDDALSSADEQDYRVDECSSDDDDWSKKHYKKRYAGSGKPRVYSRWKRKEERNVADETDVQDASMDRSLVSSPRPGTSRHADNYSPQTESEKKRVIRRRRIHVLDECRKSRRLAEKRDLKQRTEDQESVLAIEHHRAMLKAADGGEYDSENSSAPRKKRRRMTSGESDTEQKPVGAVQLWQRSRFSAENEPGDLPGNTYRSNGCHNTSEFVVPSDVSVRSAEPTDDKTGIVDSNAFLQPAFLDADGFLQPFIVGPDGILQPVNSSHFVETVVDDDGFLRPSAVLSDPALLPSLVSASQFIQPMVLNYDEVSESTGSSLCLGHMNAAGDARSSAGAKLEPFPDVSTAEEDSFAGSSSQLSLDIDQASVLPVDKRSLMVEMSLRCSMQGGDTPIQVQRDGSSEALMDCSDFTLVAETRKDDCLEELKSEVDTESGSWNQSCEENSRTIQSNDKERQWGDEEEAADQNHVQDSNLDVLIRASELMEKNSTAFGPDTGYRSTCAPPVKLDIPSNVLHSYFDPGDAGQMQQLEGCCSSDATNCIVFAADFAETGCYSLSTGQRADVNPNSLCNQHQLEIKISSSSPTQYASHSPTQYASRSPTQYASRSPTQYASSSGDAASHSQDSLSTDTHASSVKSINNMSSFTQCDDDLVTSAAEAKHMVTSPALMECRSGQVDCGITADIVSAEEGSCKQSAGNECNQPLSVGPRLGSLAASRTTSDRGSVTADESMDWTETPTMVTSSESSRPQSSLSSAVILSADQSENSSTAGRELKENIDDLEVQMSCNERESPTGSDTTDHPNAKTSVSTGQVDSLSLANRQQLSNQLTHVPFASASFSSPSTLSLSSASSQAMMSNVLPMLNTLPSVLQSATAAAVQQLTTMIMGQLLESIQMQMHQTQLQGAQNLAFPLVNAVLQSAGLSSAAGLQTIPALQQPAVLQAHSSLPASFQLPAALQQSPMLHHHSATLQQPADLQSSMHLPSSVAFQLPGLQPPVGLVGARYPFDWSSLSGLQPGSALQVDANLQAAMQNGAMVQTSLGWPNSSTGEIGSNPLASGSGMQGSGDAQSDNVMPGKMLSAESHLQASPPQSTFSTLSNSPHSSQTFLHMAPGTLSASPRFSGNLPGSLPLIQGLPGNLPGSPPVLYHVPGNLVASQPLLQTVPGNFSGLYHQPSGQFQQHPVSGSTNSVHQMTSQGFGHHIDGSVPQQIHSEPTSAYMMPMHPTNQAGSLMYRAPTAVPVYLPSFMGMQTMNSCYHPAGLHLVPSSPSAAQIQSSSAADQQVSAPAAVSSAPELSK